MYKKYSDEPARVDGMEMVMPHFRVFCGFVPESGEYVAKEIGTCKNFCFIDDIRDKFLSPKRLTVIRKHIFGLIIWFF